VAPAMKEVHISQVDAIFSNGRYPIEFLFYYKEVFSIKKLRRAMRALSPGFWPMFGQFKDGRIVYDAFREEEIFDDVAVSEAFDVAEAYEKGFDICSRFRLPEIKRLFFLKIIHLKNGLILIPKLNHLAGDGYSYFAFLSYLAVLSKSAWIPAQRLWLNSLFKPHHRRTVLKEFRFKAGDSGSGPRDEKCTIEFDSVPRTEVRRILKDAAAATDFRISTNDLLSAMAVTTLVQKRSDDFGEDIGLTLPIDVRRSVREYGPKFFGNGIMLHSIRLKKKDVDGLPLKDIAIQIRKSMPIISKESYVRYLEALEMRISEGGTDGVLPFDPRSGFLVTNLSKMSFDRLDFGSGGPALVVPLTVEKNSTAI
jgi:hypothetical protein